jgi:uncharacterized membrane protein
MRMRIELKTKFLSIFTQTTRHQKQILAMILGTILVLYALSKGFDNAILATWLGVLGYLAGYRTSKPKK